MQYNISPIKQQDQECASACLAMALNAFGIRTAQEEIIKKIQFLHSKIRYNKRIHMGACGIDPRVSE